MAEVRENDLEVAPAPREPAGVLAEEHGEGAAGLEPIAAAPAVLLDNPHEMQAAPRESMASAVLVDAPSSAAPPMPPPASLQPPSELPLRRTVGLPARPRVRVSYWFEGDELKLEAVLMDERRALVHRMQIPVGNSAEGVFTFFAQMLARDLAQTHTVLIPSSPPPAPPSSPPADDAPAAAADDAPTTAREGVETPTPAEVETDPS